MFAADIDNPLPKAQQVKLEKSFAIAKISITKKQTSIFNNVIENRGLTRFNLNIRKQNQIDNAAAAAATTIKIKLSNIISDFKNYKYISIKNYGLA